MQTVTIFNLLFSVPSGWVILYLVIKRSSQAMISSHTEATVAQCYPLYIAMTSFPVLSAIHPAAVPKPKGDIRLRLLLENSILSIQSMKSYIK